MKMKDLSFRDGIRTVPDHIEELLAGIETWKYTYQQAMDKANERAMLDKLAVAQRALIRNHFNGGQS